MINRVAYGGERIILERRSKPVLALVSMEDLELINALEDRADVKAAKKSAKRKRGVSPWNSTAETGDEESLEREHVGRYVEVSCQFADVAPVQANACP